LIKVMIVEDSAAVCEFLAYILSSDAEIQVVGTASNGAEAIAAVQHLRPDVITMDIHMPKMNGLEATRLIMETYPIPIVIVSGSADPHDVAMTFSATEAGALAALRVPPGMDHPNFQALSSELIQTIKLMAEVKVVRRWSRAPRTSVQRLPLTQSLSAPASSVEIIALGASTGGPGVLQTILAGLPKNFSVPLIVVQHMTSGFLQGLVDWLAQSSSLPVQLAVHGDQILPGRIYVAPDEFQMTLTRGGRVLLTEDAPENGLRPSVSCLFRSVGEVYGARAAAGLLTGMGRDGAQELRQLRDKGAITFVQDKESSVVHGMAGEAIKLDAAMMVLPPEKIVLLLSSLANNNQVRQPVGK
jgi:two-component system chemotaxis response regulator CheB